MAVPHFENAYGESFRQNAAAELGREIAAEMDPEASVEFDPACKRALFEAAASANQPPRTYPNGVRPRKGRSQSGSNGTKTAS
jgi:hypothetical protein